MVEWPDIPQLWSCLSQYEDRWKFVYPGVEIEREVLKMAEWLEARPKRRWPRKWKRFMTNWLSRAHGRLLAEQVRELTKREQQRVDAEVGKNRL